MQNTQFVAAVEHQARILMQRPMRQPFEHQRHRQHRPAIEDVGIQDRMLRQIKDALKRVRQRLRRSASGRHLEPFADDV